MADPIYPTGIIYKITNTTNGKFYIGQTIKSLFARWRLHCAHARRGSPTHLHSSIRKHGEDKFSLELLEHEVPRHSMNDREMLWIATMHPQYNMNIGGGSAIGYKHSAERLRKMSIAQTGLKKYPRRGLRKSPFKGKKLPPEWSANIARGKSQLWEVTTPDGETTIIRNLYRFGLDRGFRPQHLMRKGYSHGYTAKKITP